MKNHRNFLIFYTLWLGAIFMLLAIFDTSEEQQISITKQNTICEVGSSVAMDKKSNKGLSQFSCKSTENRTTKRLQ